MPDTSAFPAVFERLKQLLEPYADRVGVKTDVPGNYTLEGPPTPATKGRPSYFGGVVIHKSYVSFYVMPVYAFPDLLDSASPELLKRMQGKSCFNFRAIDEARFAELEKILAKGFKRWVSAGFVAEHPA